jgi:hypothetical protein
LKSKQGDKVMMKLKGIAATIVTIASMLALTPAMTLAAFVSGSTGADLDFTPTTSMVLPIPESGVFSFGVVNIPTGVTVTFTKNSGNTPVTILATGDVTINGTLSVNGTNGTYVVQGTGGPGGFDGGQGGTPNQNGKRGAGPGGGVGGTGQGSNNYSGNAGGGGFGASGATGSVPGWSGYPAGAAGGAVYANVQLVPLIGGSGGGGGGGSSSYNGGAGGGGGGAIVIASSGTITVAGVITANGGNAANGETSNCGGYASNSFYGGGGGGGSGGGIRLVANTITGNGTISAAGGSGGYGCGSQTSGGTGGAGRIRLEAANILRTAASNPPFTTGNAYAVVPLNLPVLSITSIGGIYVPTAPKGSFSSPDVVLPFNTQNPVTIALSGTNIPLGTTVTVKATPSVGSPSISTATLTGADASATTASISANISTVYPSIITASVTYQLSAANGGPIYAQGERVDKIRVATRAGGRSTVTYITESGKEILAAYNEDSFLH